MEILSKTEREFACCLLCIELFDFVTIKRSGAGVHAGNDKDDKG